MVIKKWNQKGINPRSYLAQIERNSYQQLWRYELGQTDRLTNRLTETWSILIYISYILGFTCYGIIIVNQEHCGCCDVLSMFIDEKLHQLVTYPVCEAPKTDFCVIWPQLTIWLASIDQWDLAIGWQSTGYHSAANIVTYQNITWPVKFLFFRSNS